MFGRENFPSFKVAVWKLHFTRLQHIFLLVVRVCFVPSFHFKISTCYPALYATYLKLQTTTKQGFKSIVYIELVMKYSGNWELFHLKSVLRQCCECSFSVQYLLLSHIIQYSILPSQWQCRWFYTIVVLFLIFSYICDMIFIAILWVTVSLLYVFFLWLLLLITRAIIHWFYYCGIMRSYSYMQANQCCLENLSRPQLSDVIICLCYYNYQNALCTLCQITS